MSVSPPDVSATPPRRRRLLPRFLLAALVFLVANWWTTADRDVWRPSASEPCPPCLSRDGTLVARISSETGVPEVVRLP